MSRGQLARTPENFPRMKHRAAGRLARKSKRPQSILEVLAEALRPIAEAFMRIGQGVGSLFPRVKISNPPMIANGFNPGFVKFTSDTAWLHEAQRIQ